MGHRTGLTVRRRHDRQETHDGASFVPRNSGRASSPRWKSTGNDGVNVCSRSTADLPGSLAPGNYSVLGLQRSGARQSV
jgi:hypothetical protein